MTSLRDRIEGMRHTRNRYDSFYSQYDPHNLGRRENREPKDRGWLLLFVIACVVLDVEFIIGLGHYARWWVLGVGVVYFAVIYTVLATDPYTSKKD